MSTRGSVPWSIWLWRCFTKINMNTLCSYSTTNIRQQRAYLVSFTIDTTGWMADDCSRSWLNPSNLRRSRNSELTFAWAERHLRFAEGFNYWSKSEIAARSPTHSRHSGLRSTGMVWWERRPIIGWAFFPISHHLIMNTPNKSSWFGIFKLQIFPTLPEKKIAFEVSTTRILVFMDCIMSPPNSESSWWFP